MIEITLATFAIATLVIVGTLIAFIALYLLDKRIL